MPTPGFAVILSSAQLRDGTLQLRTCRIAAASNPERNMEALLVSSAIESLLTHDILLAIYTGAGLLQLDRPV